jgi:hypothetical protein
MAWAQIAVEINGVKANCIPLQGRHANSSFAEWLQSRLRSDFSVQQDRGRVQFKESIEAISGWA